LKQFKRFLFCLFCLILLTAVASAQQGSGFFYPLGQRSPGCQSYYEELALWQSGMYQGPCIHDTIPATGWPFYFPEVRHYGYYTPWGCMTSDEIDFHIWMYDTMCEFGDWLDSSIMSFGNALNSLGSAVEQGPTWWTKPVDWLLDW
jgi:hypothetical protein